MGDPSAGLYGLTELMDNNPLVCADSASLTSPAGSLALIALGPLAKAELLLERPAIAYNFEVKNLDEIDDALSTEGWNDGAAVAGGEGAPVELVAEAIASIPSSITTDDLDELFDECFGRSFFVRKHLQLREGMAHATYTYTIEPQLETTLFKCRAASMADGKCGPAGLVHMFNVMSGYEESLGVIEEHVHTAR
jgi:hypothetical protein